MKTAFCLALTILVSVLTGCSGSSPTTASPPPNTNTSNAGSTAANGPSKMNISVPNGPLIGRWKGTEKVSGEELEWMPDGTMNFYRDGKKKLTLKYTYVSPAKVETKYPNGEANRSFDFTLRDDKLTVAWDQGALPDTYIRVK